MTAWAVRSALAALAAISSGCGRESGGAAAREGASGAPQARSMRSFPRFSDVTAASGVAFVHDNGHDGERYRVVETVNGGVALLDFDGDGNLDIYFTNGRRLVAGARAPRNALYRGRGDGTFEDVSAASGTGDEALSLGCSVADFDGDGRPDIYATNDGPNRLYRNRGDGTFEDVAGAAGVDQRSMDAGSAFFDMDEDGDLDLYVASYVADDRKDARPAVLRGVPSYWPPLNYRAAPDTLYENQGDGRFVDVSERSGIRAVEPGRGLGVIAADFNGDGHQDVYVANDMTANFLFLGDGKAQFVEAALETGTATGFEGEDQGSMGLALGDYDRDGLPDLLVTNYQDQLNNLFHSLRADFFEDVVHVTGVSRQNRADVSWGVCFADLDNDGWQDIYVVNGHLNPYTERMNDGTTYAQRDRIYRNLGTGGFAEVTGACGAAGGAPHVGRGAAFGDLDNDGDVDIVVVRAQGPPAVLRNECEGGQSWVLVQLVGRGRNHDAIGAVVRLTAGGATQTRWRTSSSSYLSCDDPRLHFGLGDAERVERLEVRWAGGAVEVSEDLPARRLVVIEEGVPAYRAVDLGGRRGG